jgi:hypothetical protein
VLAAAALALGTALGACGEQRAREASSSGPAAPSTRGLDLRRPAVEATASADRSAAGRLPRPLRTPSLEEELRARGAAPTAVLDIEGAPRDEPEAPRTATVSFALHDAHSTAERDLGAELRAALGSPAGCIRSDTMLRAGGRLDVHVTATVGPSGRVTRATAHAESLSTDERACLERRAGAVVLRGPVEGAPRAVTTTLAVTYRETPPPPPRDAPPPPIPLPPGARPPAYTLPAQVGDGPSPGTVPPRIVLPAQVGSGPAPGSVAPSLVLPAQGPSGTSRPITNDVTARPAPGTTSP